MTVLRLGRLEVRIEGARASFAGRIDDASPLGEVAAQLPSGGAVLDCDGVTFVNSFGIRELLRFVRALGERGPITLARVADVLMTQLNMIPEFAARVQIASFHAQYVCPVCGAESAPLVDAVEHAAALAAMQAPALPCAECGAPMELADFPERYLSIFRSR